MWRLLHWLGWLVLGGILGAVLAAIVLGTWKDLLLLPGNIDVVVIVACVVAGMAGGGWMALARGRGFGDPRRLRRPGAACAVLGLLMLAGAFVGGLGGVRGSAGHAVPIPSGSAIAAILGLLLTGVGALVFWIGWTAQRARGDDR